jgi:hypothetical protein
MNEKPFTFVYAQTHPRIPDCVGWWLVLTPTDDVTLSALDERFGTAWTAIYREKIAEGKTIIVNRNGGYCFYELGMIRSTRRTSQLIWPMGEPTPSYCR